MVNVWSTAALIAVRIRPQRFRTSLRKLKNGEQTPKTKLCLTAESGLVVQPGTCQNEAKGPLKCALPIQNAPHLVY
jgi:hypothetical protein